MHKFIITALVLLSGATTVRAQEYRDCYREWSDQPLTLDDFSGKKSKNDTLMVGLAWKYSVRMKEKKIPFGRITYPHMFLYLNRCSSWIDPAHRNENALRLGQTSFDMLEVYRRKIQKTLAYNVSTSTDAFDEVCSFYIQQHSELFEEMCDSTQIGERTDVMDMYAAQADSMLAESEVDLADAPIGTLRGRFDMGAGLNLMTTANDCYTQAPLGVDLSLVWGFRRHLFSTNFAGNFGAESKVDYDTDHGPIYQGDDVQVMQFFFRYGYLVNPRSERAVYPTFGLGFACMSGEMLPDEKEAPQVYGFSFDVGCLYELPLYRHIYKYNGMNNSYCGTANGTLRRYTGSQTGCFLLLRPSVGFAKMPDVKGMQPTLNLALIVCFSGKVYDNK